MKYQLFKFIVASMCFGTLVIILILFYFGAIFKNKILLSLEPLILAILFGFITVFIVIIRKKFILPEDEFKRYVFEFEYDGAIFCCGIFSIIVLVIWINSIIK